MKRLIPLLIGLLLVACQTDDVPPLLYVGWDADGQSQLYVQDLGRDPQALTDLTEGSLINYAVGPAAERIAYVVDHGDDSEVWLMDSDGGHPRLLLACRSAACGQLVWSPDGERLVYERSQIDASGASNTPTLHWLDARTGATQPLLENRTARGSAVRFAPDGSAVSFVSTADELTRVYNFETGETFTVPNAIGSPAEWSPDGDWLLLSNLDLVVFHGDEGDDHESHSHDYVAATRLFKADTANGQYSQLSPPMSVDDANASWSPDGEWVAFGRKQPRTDTGRQLWVMAADGSEARALSDDLRVYHGPPAWSPDASTLAFQRFELDDPTGDPEIWLADVVSAEMRQVAPSGMLPSWLAPY